MAKDGATLDDTTTWKLIHRERARLADTMEGFTATQWAAASLCDGWTVHLAAAHVVAGAEQTKGNFMKEMLVNGFRFNATMDRVAHRLGQLSPEELIARLRARTTTTNRPPGPAVTMLGEIVIHGADIRRPLGLADEVAPAATASCLDTFHDAGFPLGSRKRTQGLRLVAPDVGWSHGEGPEVSGPGQSVLLVMAGRSAGLADLSGEGVATLKERLGAA
jgi:uncharacterized protein (TIGR03083 family)